jgi:hypothetical protein
MARRIRTQSVSLIRYRFNPCIREIMAKPLTDKIAALKARQEKLALQLTTLSTKARQEDRKRDTRRKILVGGAILAAIDSDTGLADMVRLVLDMSATRPADREMLADLLKPARPADTRPAAADNAAQAAA